jgi:hypothetical protein
MNDDPARPPVKEGEAPLLDQTLRPDDFYMDGPWLIFTSAYHLRRGYCCNSNCRHCPYK